MTILHKCSKTHGHYLVLLVTNWLRRKQRKVTRSAGDLWCLPTAWAAHGRPKVLAAGLRKLSLLPPREGGAWQFLLKPLRAPCTGTFSAGRQCPAGISALLWGGGTAPPVCAGTAACCLEASPAPPQEGAARDFLCLSWRSQALDVLGAVMSRAGQGMANSRKQVFAQVPDDG